MQEIVTDYGFCDLGVTTVDERALQRVLDLLKEELNHGHRNVETLNATGVALARCGDFKEADKLFSEAIQADPSRWQVHLNRGEAAIFRGRFDHALLEIEEAMRLAPESEFRPFKVRARLHLEAKRFEDALDDYGAYLDAYTSDAKTRAFRGLTLYRAGDAEGAVSDLDASLKIDPEDAWAYQWRGHVKRSIEDFEGAIADFTEAINRSSEDASLYLQRGMLLSEVSEFEKAASDFSMAVELEPQDATGFHLRGSIRLELGDLERAKEDLTTAIQLDPANDAALEKRAIVWERLGAQQKAEADFQRIEQIPRLGRRKRSRMNHRSKEIYHVIRKHFAPNSLDDISVSERRFPLRVRADLQRAIDRLLAAEVTVHQFCGVSKKHSYHGINFSELTVQDEHDPALCVPPQYEEIHIGGEDLVRCLKSGVWLLEKDQQRFALLLEPPSDLRPSRTIRFQLACLNDDAGTSLAKRFFKELETSVASSECYRGKILSLEYSDDYSGASSGIAVHQLRQVEREQVILPEPTLALLERNVVNFVQQRPRLRQLGMSTKKGLLFYGPPGTGKTHTIHFLAKALQGHTTLLISAEQVGLLSEYMTLARLLQPSIVVMEDVDLIARERSEMDSPCEEVLLNKLLNEMDGLKEEADILFILTTNRPEALEAALASRPGRIDQAIGFPLPDEAGRRKLVALYAPQVTLDNDIISEIVRRTEGVSAAFIKELMRRIAQFTIERDGEDRIAHQDLDGALDEMLFKGGSLNLSILGAADRTEAER